MLLLKTDPVPKDSSSTLTSDKLPRRGSALAQSVSTRFRNTSCPVALVVTLKSESTKLAREAFVDRTADVSLWIRIGHLALCSPLNPTGFPQCIQASKADLAGFALEPSAKWVGSIRAWVAE
jgi:hypothetical protein